VEFDKRLYLKYQHDHHWLSNFHSVRSAFESVCDTLSGSANDLISSILGEIGAEVNRKRKKMRKRKEGLRKSTPNVLARF
jgi:hypothetical protein